MKTGQDIFESSPDAGRRDRRLRWFVAGAVLIVLVAAALMLVQKGIFERTTRLHFFADTAKGMTPGMAVKLNGFRIGTLSKLEMDAEGRVSVGLAVGDDYVHFIHKDARARWAKEDMIGESVIEILSGSPTAPVVENNALIGFERVSDVTEELSKLTSQLKPIFADVKNITAYIDNPEGDMKQTVSQLRQTVAVLTAAGKDVSEMTHDNKQQINAAIANASSALGRLDAALPQMIGRIDTSLRHLEGVAADAQQISGKLVQDLPPAVNEGRAMIGDTHEVVNAVKESWPVRNMLPPQDEHPLPLDSHVPDK